MAEENKLDNLKKEYSSLQKKYNLPGFREMNEEFYIEKISTDETEILIREVRKSVGDKLVNYMRFVENLLNPVNAPMFVFSMLKLLDSGDKEKLSEIYKKLMKSEIMFIELDLQFDEKKEADFIKESFEFWQKSKKDLLDIMVKLRKNNGDKVDSGSRGYFG